MAGNNYTIKLSDPGHQSPTEQITVTDGYVDSTQLSINLVGRNAPGYGQAFAENFVHMLENFSSPIPPAPAITGQLWYDAQAKILKVFNSQWYPVGGVHRVTTPPTNANNGDIWVDTGKNQMYIFNGTSYTLIGPNYAGTTRTGLYATTATDIYGVGHDIIINYIDDNPIEVIAKETFTPVNVIDGFSSISAGVNITSKNLGTFQAPVYARFNGTALSATKIIQNNKAIDGNLFVRNNIPQSFYDVVSFATDNGIQIGSVPDFTITKAESVGEFTNKYKDGQGGFLFHTKYNGISQPLISMSGVADSGGAYNASVDIGSVSKPNVQLTVNGKLIANDTVTLAGPVRITSSVESSNTNTGALIVAGGVAVQGTLFTKGEHILSGGLQIGGNITPEGTRSLGLYSNSWNTIYSRAYYGANGDPAEFFGRADTATRLAGGGFNINFDTVGGTEIDYAAGATTQGTDGTASPNLRLGLTFKAIYNRAVAPVVNPSAIVAPHKSAINTADTDQILVYRPATLPEPSGGNGTIYKQTKSDFLEDHLPMNSTPYVGMMMPWANIPVKLPTGVCTNVPPGWLLCDGRGYSATEYPDLFSAIRYDFSPTGTTTGDTFYVPDLTGSTAVTGSQTVNRTGGYINYIIKY
jgi:hypothetical protein